jgi:molecular chaperone GrpE (heat shock protein)
MSLDTALKVAELQRLLNDMLDEATDNGQKAEIDKLRDRLQPHVADANRVIMQETNVEFQDLAGALQVVVDAIKKENDKNKKIAEGIKVAAGLLDKLISAVT